MRSHSTRQATWAILIVLAGVGFALWQMTLLGAKLKLGSLQQFRHGCTLH